MRLSNDALNFIFIFALGAFVTATTNCAAAAVPAAGSNDEPAPVSWTAQEDHQNMMDQLGIRKLRPGPSGRAGAPNSANYDRAKANPFPDLPDPLVLQNGEKVTTAQMWWEKRRPEIVEEFEREVIGRVPKNVPKVTWCITTEATDRVVGEIPVVAKQLVGHVDNSGCPSINVDIQMTLVMPAKAKSPVPVLMMFGGFF
ncbi:MAG: acetylxylan esterase, partial [Acidobacteriota bacterium]